MGAVLRVGVQHRLKQDGHVIDVRALGIQHGWDIFQGLGGKRSSSLLHYH